VRFEKEEIAQSIPERFEKIVDRYPDRLAVKTRGHSVTYGELNRAANRLAQALLAARGGRQEPVAVLMEHDAPVVAAILGSLKAGKVYVPLDPSLPHARLQHVVNDLTASCIVTNRRHLSLARTLAGTSLDLFDSDELGSRPDANPGVAIEADRLAWVIYTSGSTGKPKGVMQTHRNVLHFMMNYTNGLHICADDRLTLLYSFSVNGGAHDIFAALLNGAALFPLDLREEGLADLGTWLDEEQITIYHSVPTVFRQLVGGLTGAEEFPCLRVVRLGGEPVYRRDVDGFRKHFSKDCILVNRLGSAETGSLRMYFMDKETPLSGNLVPVGYPVPDNEVLFLDEDGNRSVGDEGEIAVKTRYVSPGYWGSLDLTAAVFLPDPAGGEERIYRTGDLGRMLPDGCLLHLGRKEFFVKIRGYRIDLDEIEAVLRECCGMSEAVVVARNNNSGDERLVAYCVPARRPGLDVGELRASMRTRLPEYMIPGAFVVLDALPLTATGKIDRNALPDPSTARPDTATPYVAPRNPIERELAGIWAEVLSVDRVGIHDDFLALGGHSLAASRIVARAIAAFRADLSVKALFDSPTVATMAAVIAGNPEREGQRHGADA
jgi:amino acid adenylation domain-containing protein